MRAPSFLATIALAAGCAPVEVRFPADPSAETDPPLVVPIDPVLVSARTREDGVRTCADPGARERLGPFERRISASPHVSQAYLWAGGALAGDLDGDGHLDLVTPSEPYTRLYRGRPDGRMAQWDSRLSDFDLSLATGGSLADFDGDGDLDVFLQRFERTAVLLRNDGPGVFTDVTAEAGLSVDGPATASAWADLEGDGDLDLFVGSYGDLAGESNHGRSFLYLNRGDGTFADHSDELPESVHRGYTRVGGFHDLDGDRLPELYVVNDVGSVAPNLLLWNRDGRLVEDGGLAGLDLQMSGGGLGIGDLNGDGRLDLLIPQWDQISLMVSGADGRWFDRASISGLRTDAARGQRVGWGAELADLDNDGDLDGVVAYGRFEVDLEYWGNPDHQPDALFLQQEDGSFEDAAAAWGVDDDGVQRGFVVADFDDDGWLDLAKRDLVGPTALYLSRCGAEHWLKVSLEDPDTLNRFAVGAVVSVLLEDGSRVVRTVTAGGTGYGTGGPPELHFGLGLADRVERIDVGWPDGGDSRVAFGAAADQRITITRAR